MLCNIALVFISYLVRIFMRIIFISTVHKYLKQRLRQSGCRHTKTSLDQYDINNIVIVLFNTNYNNYTYWHLYFHYYVIYFTTLYAELSRSCYQREEFRVFNCPERESNPQLTIIFLKNYIFGLIDVRGFVIIIKTSAYYELLQTVLLNRI